MLFVLLEKGDLKMAGNDTVRGILVQTIIALLDILQDKDGWTSITLEPNLVSEKVDILIQYADKVKVVQVKSSTNRIEKSDVIAWAKELESSTKADLYEIVIVGTCSKTVVNELPSIGKVLKRQPKNLDLDSLFSEAAHKLGKYIETTDLPTVSSSTLEVLAKALITELQSYSSSSSVLERSQLQSLISNWIITHNKPINTEQIPAEKYRYTKFEFYSNLLVLGLVIICLIWLIFSNSFIAKHQSYFQNRNEYAFDTQKKLFEKSFAHLVIIDTCYRRLSDSLISGPALTPNEINNLSRDFKSSLASFSDFSKEVERTGSDTQIQMVNNILQWALTDYSFLLMYKDKADEVFNTLKHLTEIKNKKSDLFVALNNSFERQLDELIEQENELYFSIALYRYPAFNQMDQVFNSQFRVLIGVANHQTSQEALQKLQFLLKKSQEFKYEHNKYPYVIAQARRSISPDFKTNVDDVLTDKNLQLKQTIKLKYFNYVIQEHLTT